MKEVKGIFIAERKCKHSRRYVAKDDEAKSLATVIYVNNDAVAQLENPKEIHVTMRRGEV